LILFALLGAIVTGAWRYASDYRSHQEAYQNALEEQQGVAQQSTAEELQSQLDDDEISGVYSALYYGKRVKEASAYLNDSILMQENGYAQNVEYIFLEVDPSNGSETEIQQYLYSNEFIQEVLDESGWTVEDRYVRELIESEIEDESIKVTVTGIYSDTCRELGDAVLAVIQKNYSDVLLDVYRTDDVVINTALIELYSDIYNDCSTSSLVFSSYERNFTYGQKKLYIALANADEDAKQIDSPQEAVLAPTKWNFKMSAVGFLAGIVLLAFLIGVYYTFSPAIHGEDEVRSLYDADVIGNVDIRDRKKKRLFSGVDRWINRIGIYHGQKLSGQQQLEMAASYLALCCSKNACRTLYLTGSEIEKVDASFLEQLKEDVKEHNIELQIGGDLLSDSHAAEEAVKADAVVMIALDEVTKCALLTKEFDFCFKQEVKNLGVILLQA
jgi:hypothetical protein